MSLLRHLANQVSGCWQHEEAAVLPLASDRTACVAREPAGGISRATMLGERLGA
jgi:hypothetical protein